MDASPNVDERKHKANPGFHRFIYDVREVLKKTFSLGPKLEARRIVEIVADRRDADLTLGELPPPSERLKEAEVLKLCDQWQPRFLVLTSSDLMITLPQSQEISDKIPLVRFFSPICYSHVI